MRLARIAGVEDYRALLLPPPKHADIAARVGTHREGVTREITALQKLGLIERATVEGRRAMAVTDVERLQQMLETMRG